MTSAAAIPALLAAAPASAQSITLDAPPVRQPLDENGVDLSSGGIVVPSSTLAIGGQDGLVHSRHRVGNGWNHNYLLSIRSEATPEGKLYRVILGGTTIEFLNSSPGVFEPQNGELGSFTTASGNFIYIDVSGTKYTFNKSLVANYESYYGAVEAVGTKIERPDGQITTLNYRNSSYSVGRLMYVIRLQSVVNSTGYHLKFSYATDVPVAGSSDEWYRVTKVTAINRAVEYCDPAADSCNLTQPWPYLTYSQDATRTIETVTDILGREARFTNDGARRLKAVKRPGENSDGMFIAYDADSRVDWITFQNSYVRDYNWSQDANGNLVSVSTDHLGRTRTVVTNPDAHVILSDTDALGDVTSYTYDSEDRADKITAPEGNVIDLTRDSRGRVTQVKHIAKGGATNIITGASYPALDASGLRCANAVTCDTPLTTTDANGKVTSYSYDQTHGGVLSVTSPADDSGNHPVTSFEYAGKYARRLSSTGNLISETVPVARLVKSSVCRTATTCTGSANEQVSELIYDNQAAPNLQPVSSKVRTGANTLVSTTSYTYGRLGNVATVDGPMAYDITAFRYDAVGQQVGAISADPDGAGAQPRLASRTTYNADGQATKSESGTVAGTSDTDWAAFAPVQEFRTSYDAFGRVATSSQVLPGGNAQYSLAQYSYDYAGRPDCVALRMNAPSTSTNLPADACEPMAEGAYGPDRIEKNYYDAADQLTQTFSGVGTDFQQRTAMLEYTDNGKTKAAIDAKGNRTEYLFDGYGRAYRIKYPDPTTPGVASATDYENVTYNADGTIASYRNRMGETINLYYDDLGRVVAKGVPNRTGLAARHTRNVSYAYDLFGNMTEARFGGLTGLGFSYRYNGIGQLVGTDDKMQTSTVRSLGYEYDIAGRRAALIHPDGARFTYEYDTLGRLRFVRRDAGSGAADRLLENVFTPTGELDLRLASGSAYRSAFAHDGARRTREQRIFKNGSSYDLTHGWEHNPASQVVNETKDNALHHWDGHPAQTIDHDYAANGLNQYTAVGAQALTYDANGNLIADGFNAYTYDVENRLVAVSGQNGAELTYDPLGRLHEVRDGAGAVQRTNLYDGDALIGEYSAGGAMLARHVHGLSAGDDPIASYTGAGTTLADIRFLYRDRLGSVAMSAASNAASPEAYTYDEFGVHGSATPPRFGYTGQAWVPEAGLYYYKARMYSPGLGRFMQPDPIGFAGGMNWYAYVANDPVNGVDPSGLAVEPVTGTRLRGGAPAGLFGYVRGYDAEGQRARVTIGNDESDSSSGGHGDETGGQNDDGITGEIVVTAQEAARRASTAAHNALTDARQAIGDPAGDLNVIIVEGIRQTIKGSQWKKDAQVIVVQLPWWMSPTAVRNAYFLSVLGTVAKPPRIEDGQEIVVVRKGYFVTSRTASTGQPAIQFRDRTTGLNITYKFEN